MLQYYILFTTICTFLLFLWVLRRITHPLTYVRSLPVAANADRELTL